MSSFKSDKMIKRRATKRLITLFRWACRSAKPDKKWSGTITQFRYYFTLLGQFLRALNESGKRVCFES
ncbi:MAG: hypothetical protein VXV91_00315, partial [Verrucomicrobiota bacterium]|nr:hypothetical protein [Verrucomicrobiota bacterium]MEC7235243.1 hypothetical protein [Verrucomicrobiota bacterium]